MKLLLFITITFFSFSSLAIEAGEYICVEGNNDSICRQKVKVYETDNEITALKVTYIGWCEGMGYNMFYCKDDECISGYQKIVFLGEESYQWENRAYDIICNEFILDKD